MTQESGHCLTGYLWIRVSHKAAVISTSIRSTSKFIHKAVGCRSGPSWLLAGDLSSCHVGLFMGQHTTRLLASFRVSQRGSESRCLKWNLESLSNLILEVTFHHFTAFFSLEVSHWVWPMLKRRWPHQGGNTKKGNRWGYPPQEAAGELWVGEWQDQFDCFYNKQYK